MCRIIACSALVIMFMCATAFGAPVYTETWDFEDGTPGNPHPDWNAGTVYDMSPLQNLAYPGNQRLWAGNTTEAVHTLPETTNSFIFMADLWTDDGDAPEYNGDGGAFIGKGLAFYYDRAVEDNKAWFHGCGSNVRAWRDGGEHHFWPSSLHYGDPTLPNPRPGSPTENDPMPAYPNDYQWPGDYGRVTHWFRMENQQATLPEIINMKLMIKYNTPDNPGTVEVYYMPLNYTTIFGDAPGTWVKGEYLLSDGTWVDNFILAEDPDTGEPYAISSIELGGSANGFAEGEVAYDDVYFESIPEPSMISLLGLGAVALLRRRFQ